MAGRDGSPTWLRSLLLLLLAKAMAMAMAAGVGVVVLGCACYAGIMAIGDGRIDGAGRRAHGIKRGSEPKYEDSNARR